MYVMKPFSYSRCAMLIADLAEKPSLRDASCCSVVVRNGAYGDRRYGLRSTDRTEKSVLESRSARAAAASPSRCSSAAPSCCALAAAGRSSPVGVKSRPCATRRPSTATSAAGDEGTAPSAAPSPRRLPPVATLANTAPQVQYPAPPHPG